MQSATSETESKSRDLSMCVHRYTFRAPCPKGQGTLLEESQWGFFKRTTVLLHHDTHGETQSTSAQRCHVTSPRRTMSLIGRAYKSEHVIGGAWSALLYSTSMGQIQQFDPTNNFWHVVSLFRLSLFWHSWQRLSRTTWHFAALLGLLWLCVKEGIVSP